MEVIILSGGLGTRLSSVIENIPKVMAPINGKPFLTYMLDNMCKSGVKKVVLATGYRKEYIKDYFGDEYKNIKIEYSEEEYPLGTGGAIKKALKLCNNDNVIITNGDIFTNIDYKKIYSSHIDSNSDVTLSLLEMENFDRYGSIEIDGSRIINFKEKEYVEKGYMNVGCYVFKRDILDKLNFEEKFSIEKDFFMQYVNSMNFSHYIYDDIFVEIGIPEDYELAKNILKEEIINEEVAV